MGERIGRPLTEQIGKPRVLPDAIPLPLPALEPMKKEEPVKVLPDGTEAYLRFRADQAQNGTVEALARHLHISTEEVEETMESVVSRLRAIFLQTMELEKEQTEAGEKHPDDCNDCARA